MRSDNMLLLHGNNRYHAKEREYQGTDIVAENTYRAELGLKVYGKSTQNGVPSPENPIPINSIGDSGSVDVVVTGKNLIPTNLAQDGISYNADTKRWKFEALSKYGLVNVRIIDPNRGSYILPAGQYTLTVIGSQNMQVTIISSIGNKNDWKTLLSLIETKPSDTFTLTEDTMIGLFVIPKDVTQPGYVQIQLERGATATSYQPYREPQTLTINTPNGLCGIPVDTDGNYTDSTGQQWICDEVDFERGVYVQRVKKSTVKAFNALQETQYQGKYVNWNIFSVKYATAAVKSIIAIASYFAWGQPQPLKWIGATEGRGLYISPPKNTDYTVDTLKSYLTPLLPFEIRGVLVAPIETPLTAEELAAYKAIKSYPHYTRIESAAELGVKLKEY